MKYFLQKSEDLAKQNAELGSFRTAELEMCIKLREDLAKAKVNWFFYFIPQCHVIISSQEAAELGESAKRSMEAQQAVVMQAEAKEAEALAQLQDTVALNHQYEKKLQEAGQAMELMEEEIKDLHEALEPFKEQIEQQATEKMELEVERMALLSQSEAAKSEVRVLSLGT